MTAFRVGEWSVEPELGRVSSPESEANLQPQVMQLLVYLARHPREVISIDRMIDEVWAGKPMTSGSVYNALNTLRKTFGDSKDQPRYIETIPRKGYRLIAPVVEESALEQSDRLLGETGPKAEQAAGPGRHRLILIGTAAVVLVGLLLFWSAGKGPDDPEVAPRPPSAPDKSIAVLPFADLSPEGDQQYLAEGMAEEILNVIARHPDLKVVGRSSSFRFRDAADLKDVGQKLGVAHVLEGSVRRDGDRLRVTAQLIETTGGYHMWSESYDTELGDVFQIQDDIAGQIAEQLQLSVLGQGQAGPDSGGSAPADLGAHDLYLLAKYRVRQGGNKNLREAIEYLEQALEMDPDYARARVELAFALYYEPLDDRQEWLARRNPGGLIDQQARMALAVDPRLSGAYAIQGTLNYVRATGGVFLPASAVDAERQLARAIELNPNDGSALLWYSGLKRFQGRPLNEAIDFARRAVELEPLLQFATDWYLGLLAGRPAFSLEREKLVSRVQDGAMGWEQTNPTIMSNIWWSEGRLARALEESDTDDPLEALSRSELLIQLTEMNEALSLRGQVSHRMLKQKLGLIDLLRNPAADSFCGSAEPGSLSIEYLKACVRQSLVLGLYDRVNSLLLDNLPGDPDAYAQRLRHTFGDWDSVEMAQASLASLQEDAQRLERHAQGIESFLGAVYGDPATHGYDSESAYSLLYALRGEHAESLDALSNAIEWGQRDWRIFMHPAYIELREDPRFAAILERWITLLNVERLQLGLPPRQLNADVGPGKPPFVLEPGELEPSPALPEEG